MIMVDTHIWEWWVEDSPRLSTTHARIINENQRLGGGVSVLSCWEIAKLVQIGRLPLPLPIDEWLKRALAYPGIWLLPLTPEIAVASTTLPGRFHRDPADQIIVATAHELNIPLLTVDARILAYPHVTTVGPA